MQWQHFFNSLCITLLLALAPTQQSQAGDPPPDFSLPTLAGGTVQLSKHKGEVVYVDFWATWCAPCRKSLPWMEQMHQKYKDLGFTIIGVNMDGKQEVAEKFVKEHNVTFTIALDPKGKIAEAYGVRGMPSSYVIGRDGNIRFAHEGFRESDRARIEKVFKEAIAQ